MSNSRCLTEDEHQALVVATAEALASQGQIEEAMPLFVSSQGWEPAIRLIVTQAQALLALGRWQTVQQWIESLPEAIRNTTPWLGFWLGMCRLRVDPARARLDLEPAFTLFQQADDVLGQALAATAINEAHMVEWVDYRRLDPWIALLEALLSRGDAALPSLDTELAVRASLFTAIVLRQSYREDIPHLAWQLAQMLRHDLDPNYKLLAARGIFVYGAYSADFLLTDEVISYTTWKVIGYGIDPLKNISLLNQLVTKKTLKDSSANFFRTFNGLRLTFQVVISYTKSAFDAPGASALNRAWYAARLGFALRYVRGCREKARA
jgi:hypothetical protein